MKIMWIEQELDVVIDYFAQDFKPKDGEITRIDWFIDHVKDKVIFKLFVKEMTDVASDEAREVG